MSKARSMRAGQLAAGVAAALRREVAARERQHREGEQEGEAGQQPVGQAVVEQLDAL
jgi:hypothetical protein